MVGSVYLGLEAFCPVGANISSKDPIDMAFRVPVTRVMGHREGQSHDFPPGVNMSLKNFCVACNLQLGYFYRKPRVSKRVFSRGQITDIFSSVVSVATTQLCMKAARQYANEGCGCVSLKIYLQKAIG